MRKPIIAANWKMYKTLSEAETFVKEIKDLVPGREKIEAVVCPPALFLSSLVSIAKGSEVDIGAQNMHFDECGAYTGEISPMALEDLGVKYVIIGHSERRQMFNEIDESVNKKVLASFKYHLLPIVCVGETLAQYESGKTKEVVGSQVQKALAGLSEEQARQIVIAYEPRWAIGTGKAATAKDANEVCGYIRKVVSKHFSSDIAAAIRIQYGGSVKAENIKEFMDQDEIDGALVGGASLDPKVFLRILEEGKYE